MKFAIRLAILFSVTYLLSGAIFYEGEEALKVELVDRNGLILYSNYRPSEVLKVISPDAEYVKRLLSQGSSTTSGKHDHPGIGPEIHVLAREQGYLDFRGNDWTLLIHFSLHH